MSSRAQIELLYNDIIGDYWRRGRLGKGGCQQIAGSFIEGPREGGPGELERHSETVLVGKDQRFLIGREGIAASSTVASSSLKTSVAGIILCLERWRLDSVKGEAHNK